ncbi:MAG: hypothetical protein KDI13_02380 [Alphaproteobacteria bacterium]|nr:hypothetical protein [Alphaproteobacteria bacterium]
MEKNKKPRRKWKQWILFVFFLIIGPTQYLNHTGFCYQEMRYLDKREIVDGFLFSKKYGRHIEVSNIRNMTLGEKKKIMKVRGIETYPNNCRIQSINQNVIYLFYNLECVRPHPEKSENLYAFEVTYYSIDACGKKHNFMSEILTGEESYNIQIERNKKYWDKIGGKK